MHHSVVKNVQQINNVNAIFESQINPNSFWERAGHTYVAPTGTFRYYTKTWVDTFWIGSAVLILWWPLKQIPFLGSVLNIFILAFVVDYAQPYLPTVGSASLLVTAAAVGALIAVFGVAFYL